MSDLKTLLAVQKRINEAYDEFVAGGSSPSATDLVNYAAEIVGVEPYSFEIDGIASDVYQAQCEGAGVAEVALLILTSFSEQLLERRA